MCDCDGLGYGRDGNINSTISVSKMNSIEQTKKTRQSSKVHGLMEGMEGLIPFPLTCVYKSPLKTSVDEGLHTRVTQTGAKFGAEQDRPDGCCCS